MSQVSFVTTSTLQTVLSLAGTFAASRFSLISCSAAPIQAAAFVIISIFQSVLQKNYQLNKGYYCASFAGMTALGIFLKTSWKANLLMTTLFVTLQSIFSRFQKPNHEVPLRARKEPSSTTAPVTCVLESTPSSPTDSKNHYIQLDIFATSEQDKDLSLPAEFIFCIDTSNSMKSIDEVKKMLINLLSSIEEELNRHQDRPFYISLVVFDHRAKTIQKKIQVTKANISDLKGTVLRLTTGGGEPSIMAGLEEATQALGNLSLFDWIAAFFVTPLARSVDICARSLIFLTAGDDNRMDERRVRELQKKWSEKSVNLFAIGISKSPQVATMKMIVCDQAGQLLPNSSYQWITSDDKDYTLDKACIRIFYETRDQNIRSISVRQTSNPILQILNNNQTKDGTSKLGALSKGQRIKKIFYCNSLEFKEFSLEISVQTQQGDHVVCTTIDLSDSYSRFVHQLGIEQRIVEMNRKLSSTKGENQEADVLDEAKAFFPNDVELGELIDDLKKTDDQDQERAIRYQLSARGRYDPFSWS